MHIVLMLAGGVLGGVVSWNKGRNVFLWTILCGVMPLFVLQLVALPRIPREGVVAALPLLPQDNPVAGPRVCLLPARCTAAPRCQLPLLQYDHLGRTGRVPALRPACAVV